MSSVGVEQSQPTETVSNTPPRRRGLDARSAYANLQIRREWLPSHLDPLVRALGGTSAFGRFLGVTKALAWGWRRGRRPLPSDKARLLQAEARRLSAELLATAARLDEDIRAGDERVRRSKALKRKRFGEMLKRYQV